ncbi:MAG: exodeoxyribonuclease V subunit gamma [Lachnospiraceae bacterium]|nr:exodeoxyribonuclease V subunit gamma [Lachnospiraceae bacterium]
MNLQIIAGPSGTGKSTYIYKKILGEAQQNPKKHYLILVPLQYSMQTQRILVFLSLRKSIINVDVLSFERLAYRVFDELGAKKNVCLDETGKVLLLRRAASLIRDDLGLLKKNISRRGYIDEVKSLISELMQYGYEPSDVGEMAEKAGLPDTFREKAEDVEKLYRKFLSLLGESMFTQEQVLTLLCEVADQSELIRDSVIVLDGYTGFTPVQKELLTRLVPLVDTVYACVTCDISADLYHAGEEEGLFYMSREEAAFLNGLKGTELLDPVYIDRGNGRFKDGGPLAFLEENLFRENGKSLPDSEGRIELCELRDVKTEILFTAEKIHQMVRKNESLHYRDFAIVCPDVETYRYSVKRIFDAQGIPVFLDEKKEALFNPLTEFIDAALDMVKRRLSYESLMRFLRSGLTPLSAKETDILDNYLYEASFRNTRYLKESFKRKTQDFTKDSAFEKLNAIRVKIAAPVMKFYDAEKGRSATVRERLTALFELLMTFHAEEKLNYRADKKQEEGDMVSEDLYRRLYGFFCDLSDQMVELLGDEKVNVSDFRDMLLDGLDEIKPATVPKSNDTVIFGDLERTRLSDVKVLFLIGAGDDQIPKAGSDAGIFSEEERVLLKENGFELAPTDRERSAQQKFYLYLCMTKASEKLFITYHGAGSDGENTNASYLFEEMQRLFTDLVIHRISSDDPVFLETENSADAVMTRGLEQLINEDATSLVRDRTAELLDVKAVSGNTGIRKAFLDAAFSENQKTPLKQAVTDALYGKSLTMSVSRLETFAKCPCSYLLKYGLKLTPRKKNEFASLDLGNLYHGAIEKYAKGLKADGLGWDSVTPDEMNRRLQAGFDDELKDFAGSELFEDAREDHFSKQAYLNLLLNTQVMTEELKAGRFMPSYFEQELKDLCEASDLTFDVGDGHTLSLTGKIDRIDLARSGEKTYVKIIDYKTGTNKLDPVRIYEGIQMQLLLYMDMALKGLSQKSTGEVLPAAVFYYMLTDPRIPEERRLDDQSRRDEIEKVLRPSGIMINDETVIGALDEKLITEESYTSKAVDLKTKSKGGLSASGSLVTPEDFSTIRDFTKDKAISLGSRIVHGDASVLPYRKGSDTGCKYCIYKGVCHFDPRLNGYYYRDISHVLDDDTAESDDDGKKKTVSLKSLVAKISGSKQSGKESSR